MAEILEPSEELREKLHPHALKRLEEWRAEVNQEIPQLVELTLEEINADLSRYLEDTEKTRIKKYYDDILEWLKACVDVGSSPSSYSPIYATWVISSMLNFKWLLKKAYQWKEEEAEAERREKEAEERRAAARKVIKPPIDDAERYLNRPGEYDKFIQSIEGAIDAYLAEPEGYLDNMKAHKYKWCLIEISDRRQEEAQRLRATLAANEYNHCLNQEIAKLTSQLEHKRKDLLSYFQAKIQDKRYTGHNFDYVLSAEEKHSFDGTLVSVANKKLEQLISNDLRQFIDIPSQYYRIYLPLPSIDYSLEGIPCLNFCFDVFAAAYAEVWLKPGKKSFGGYEFHLPRIEEKNYSVLLQEPRFLGYYYLILRPEDLGGYIFWQSIPLVLLKGLLNGETKPKGTTISAASDGMITYKIPKFKEEVDIPNKFANYLKDIGSIDEMVSKFKMNEKVASIVRAESEELKVKHKALSLEEKTEGKHTKKAKAFLLFSQGKGPSSPEVKTLGLHKSTRFKYYNQYLAVHKP